MAYVSDKCKTNEKTAKSQNWQIRNKIIFSFDRFKQNTISLKILL